MMSQVEKLEYNLYLNVQNNLPSLEFKPETSGLQAGLLSANHYTTGLLGKLSTTCEMQQTKLYSNSNPVQMANPTSKSS